jgi:hypothetical protein
MELMEFLNARSKGIYASRRERFEKMIRSRNISIRKECKRSAYENSCIQGNAQAARRRRQERAEHGRIITPLHTPAAV